MKISFVNLSIPDNGTEKHNNPVFRNVSDAMTTVNRTTSHA